MSAAAATAASTSAFRTSKRTVALSQRLERLRNGPATFKLPAEVRELELTFAKRNQDYGARRFSKLDLPSLLYANPELKVTMHRPETVRRSEMMVRYKDGQSKSIRLSRKTFDMIREELRGIAMGSATAQQQSVPSTTPSKPATPTGEIEAGVDYGTARE